MLHKSLPESEVHTQCRGRRAQSGQWDRTGSGGAADGAADVAILRSPFDQHGLDWDILLVEPRVAVLPAGHPLASRPQLSRADLSGEVMPNWAGQTDPATAAYWTGTDLGAPAPAPVPRLAGGARPAPGPRPAGPQINDMNQLLDVVALGQAVAFVPLSTAHRYGAGDLVFRPVTDLSPSEVISAWPGTSCSPAAADLPAQAAALA